MVPTYDGVYEEVVLILNCSTIWNVQGLCVVSFVFFDWVDGYTIPIYLWFYLFIDRTEQVTFTDRTEQVTFTNRT
jgi:hypothetical protein